MNAELRRRLQQARDWIDDRSLRERAMLGAAALCVLVALWSLLLMDPLTARRAQLRNETDQVVEQSRELEAQGESILAAHAVDPNLDLRSRKQELRSQIGALDGQIREQTVSMIAPDEMALLLETMLEEDAELSLVRLENRGAEPLLAELGVEDSPGIGVFKHSFEVVLEGGYLSTLRYLRALEALPWNFFWDAVEFEVQDYPMGRATIRAYTLSGEEGWIGA